jgi:hypothetical protein
MFDMMNDTRRAYRQGDVLLVPCAGIPADACEEAPEGGRVILAHGERTGHCHAMAADRVRHFRQDRVDRVDGRRAFVRVAGSAPVALQHDEHASLMIPPGDYRVIQQREYRPRAAPRAVID